MMNRFTGDKVRTIPGKRVLVPAYDVNMDMKILYIITWLNLLTTVNLMSISSNVGREFIIVFPEHVINDSEQTLYFSTTETRTVTVSISAPLVPHLQKLVKTTVTKGVSRNVKISNGLNLAYSKVYSRGILITSDGDISVQCFTLSTISKFPDTSGGYLALPTNSLGNEYLIVTYCEANSCMFAVVGTVDGTKVRITLKIADNKNVEFKKVTYSSGDVIDVELDRYVAVELQSHGDLSGSKVDASHPVGVFIAADYTTVDGASPAEDHIIEQLPPLNVWGMDYVLVPFYGRTIGDLIVVVAQFSMTHIKFQTSEYMILQAGEKMHLKLSSSSSATMTANKRILVMHLSRSYKSSEQNYTDPSMVLVPPLQQWRGQYTFSSPLIGSSTRPVMLALITSTSCTGHVKLDAGIASTAWTEVSGTDWSVVYVMVSSDTVHYLDDDTTDKCSTTGGYLYGAGYHKAWSMPIGWSFSVLPAERSKTTTSTTTAAVTTENIKINISSAQVKAATSTFKNDQTSTPTEETSSSQNTSSLFYSSIESTLPSLADTLLPSSVDHRFTISSGVESIQVSPSTVLGSSTSARSSIFGEIHSGASMSFKASYLESSAGATILVSSSIDIAPSSTAFTANPACLPSEVLMFGSTLTTCGISDIIEETKTTSVRTLAPTAQTLRTSMLAVSTTTVNPSRCLCRCRNPTSLSEITSSLNEKIEEIQKSLSIDTVTLSSTIRKHVSIPDDRPSAVALGALGIAFVTCTIIMISAPDLFGVIRYMAGKRLTKDTKRLC